MISVFILPMERVGIVAFRYLSLLGCGLLLGYWAPQAEAAAPTPIPTPDEPLFSDVSEAAGLDFVHFNGMSGEFYFPEMTGQGGALFDYDNDGDLDIYLVQGAMLGAGKTLADALFPPRNVPPRDRLYRNDTTLGKNGISTLRFTDVTEESKLRVEDYGMGVATADYDNDGWVDLYITNYGANRLLHNNGDGTFSDVTATAGVADQHWSTSATFFDYDRDGWLDLYVANYIDYAPERNKRCYAKSSRQDYCGPSAFKPQADRLFKNRGDGTFEDVTTQVLQGYKAGPGLGVVAADFNGDGWPDLYVANDGVPNQLWLNQQGKGFVDDALFAGVAVNGDGMAEASMGVDAGDFDGDGDPDLFMTHLAGETNTLYRNDGSGLFEDQTLAVGLAAVSFPYTSFGTAWFDYDNDGWLDLLALNGAVRVVESLARKGDAYPLHQPNQLFQNHGGKRFSEITGSQVSAFKISEVSRGAAIGDLDNDGDPDLVVFNNNGRARLLRNNNGNNNRWLGLRLMDKKGMRDLVGARVEAMLPKRPAIWRRARSDGSYCSANDSRVLIGLGDGPPPEAVRIHWPDGSVEVLEQPQIGRYTTLHQGWSRKEKAK